MQLIALDEFGLSWGHTDIYFKKWQRQKNSFWKHQCTRRLGLSYCKTTDVWRGKRACRSQETATERRDYLPPETQTWWGYSYYTPLAVKRFESLFLAMKCWIKCIILVSIVAGWTNICISVISPSFWDWTIWGQKDFSWNRLFLNGRRPCHYPKLRRTNPRGRRVQSVRSH